MNTFDDGNDACANCLTKQNAASNMTNTVFQVNTDPKCGHKFCNNCLHENFSNQGKRQFACKACATQGRSSTVKKEKLSIKSLDETEAERDIRMRKRIKAIFNKTEESFATADEFRDYEEEVEDIIYNLVHDINIPATNQKIENYRRENEEAIYFNQSKIMEQKGEMDRKIRTQSEQLQLKLQAAHEAAAKERLYKKVQAKQMNQVLLGERDAVDMGGLDGPVGSDGAAAAPTLYAQSHVFALLHPREPPKVIYSKADAKEPKPANNQERRAAHVAGGYDEKNRWRRNWAEIVSHPAFRSRMDIEGNRPWPQWD